MGNLFSGAEIIEMSINIEKNGKDYYETSAGCAKKDIVKEAFLFLAKEEEKHMNTFKEMLKNDESAVSDRIYEDEYEDYLKAFIESNVFTKKKKACDIAKKMKSDVDAIDMAIASEKDSILFYYELKESATPKAKKVIDKLIKQEKQHFSKLAGLAKKLK